MHYLLDIVDLLHYLTRGFSYGLWSIQGLEGDETATGVGRELEGWESDRDTRFRCVVSEKGGPEAKCTEPKNWRDHFCACSSEGALQAGEGVKEGAESVVGGVRCI